MVTNHVADKCIRVLEEEIVHMRKNQKQILQQHVEENSYVSKSTGVELAGNISPHAGNLTFLRFLSLGGNRFHGEIPRELSGEIQGGISNCSELANCSNLQQLYFDGNNFGGELPSSIGKMSNLVQLGLGRNPKSGTIPEEVGNLVNLYRLDMDGNLFSGSIPISFGKRQKLERLTLNHNLLSREIPVFLGPSHPEADNLKSIIAFDVSENILCAEIPKTIRDFSKLEILNMQGNFQQGNFLQGPIPSSFVSSKGLQRIDLSRNNLSGNITNEKLIFLQYLNLSFNNFEGEVPKTGVFSNASAFSLVGNRDLCGGIPELQLPECPGKEEKHKKPSIVTILATTISSILFVMIVMSLCVFYWRKSRKSLIFSPVTVDKLPQISYKELLQATSGFSSENLIGQGSFGSVYKVILQQLGECFVAVKVLNLQQHGASKELHC
ncbi:putative receptor-like protein kinase At3g47110 [Hevea brasiliensis]|uniref:putative receptor-like protein kinase At3g47110 n=1 Tax=Hevea brasiliensis TaxID=3981 RepID=UPI0025D2806B|nr:putative receptor-like protein kinase At3g47110 [Hevea brasiliensis]